MSRAADFILDFFFPNLCPFCGRFIPYDRLCCDECAPKISLGEFCRRCGQHVCVCDKGLPDFDGCIALMPYTGLCRDGVLNLKYDRGFNLAKLMVPEGLKLLKGEGWLNEASIITAVPMTPKRRERTGDNQAEYIAKRLSKLSGLPCDFKLIRKNPRAAAQHELTRDEREKEAKRTYLPPKRKRLHGETVILCDDIITTGSTLSSCAAVLKSIGAKKVYCLTLAGSYAMEENNKE